MRCAECPNAYEERAPRKTVMLRCGAAEGYWSGRTVEHYPEGMRATVRDHRPPAWCPRIKKGQPVERLA